MKYKFNVKLVNETKYVRLFNKYDYSLYKFIYEILLNNFDRSLNLVVIFKEIVEKKHVHEETCDGYTYIKDDVATITLNYDILKSIACDGGYFIAKAIEHEIIHIYDYFSIFPRKPKYDLFTNHYVNKEHLFLCFGWGFWTEINSYYKTFKAYKSPRDSYTFLKIVNIYEKLEELYISAMEKSAANPTQNHSDMFGFLVDNMHSFIYICAKYIARFFCIGNQYEYSNIHKSKQSFKKVHKFMNKMIDMSCDIFLKAYKHSMETKLIKLGKTIINTFYKSFGVFPIKHNNLIYLAIYTQHTKSKE